MTQTALRKTSIYLLLIPLSFLLLFTFGEVASGDLSGLSHLVVALPIILIILIAQKSPKHTGIVMSLISFFLAILYAISVAFNFWTIFIVEILLFIPPFVSGILLYLSSQKKKTRKSNK